MMSLMTSLKDTIFATGKLLNQLFQIFQGTNKFWSDLVYAAMKARHVHFSVVFFRPNFDSKFV